MWIPKNEAEIITVVQSGSLQETTTFDAKEQISSNSTEIAKDIAAMTNDGGVIIYGIGEDAQQRLTALSPIELAGQSERINQIARTAISEPPIIYVYPIETAADPNKGYLVVEIPPSPRAPHMVMVGKNYRFYGRTSAGNACLTEGEVARLYARRQQTEVDRERLLQQEIERHPFEPVPTLAYLYAFARPVFPDDTIVKRACHAYKPGNSVPDALRQFVKASKENPLIKSPGNNSNPYNYSPHIEPPRFFDPRVDGYRGDCMGGGENDPEKLLRFEVEHNGGGHLFCGGAAFTRANESNLWFYSELVAGNIAQFLYFMGMLYSKAEYHGAVDLGMAVTGLKGCLPFERRGRSHGWSPYDQNEYRRTQRCTAQELMDDTRSVATELVMPLIQTITQGGTDPFAR